MQYVFPKRHLHTYKHIYLNRETLLCVVIKQNMTQEPKVTLEIPKCQLVNQIWQTLASILCREFQVLFCSILFLAYEYEYLVCVSICAICLCLVLEEVKRGLSLLKLELQMLVKYHIGCWEPNPEDFARAADGYDCCTTPLAHIFHPLTKQELENLSKQ